MNSKKDKFNKNRLRTAYISVVVSISLVLFMVGLLSVVLLFTYSFSNQVKEQITFTAFLDPMAKEVDMRSFEKSLHQMKEIKSVEHISKEEAAKSMQAYLGEDFLDLLDFNPLFDAVDINFKSSFVNIENLSKVEEKIRKNSIVKDVVYEKSAIYTIGKNIKKISIALLAFCSVFLLIAISLINNAIRLAIYSKRFTIRTMQLVGATKSFIRRPFLKSSFFQALIASIFACLMLVGALVFLEKQILSFSLLENMNYLGAIAATIFVTGIIISWICTFFSVRKYLNLKSSELYF